MGFLDECAGIPLALEQNANVDLVEWCGRNERCTVDIIKLFDGDFEDPPGVILPPQIYSELYLHLAHFFNLYGRKYQDDRVYHRRNVYDFTDLFNRYVNLFYDRILRHGVTSVVFSNLPHEGPDFVLYHLARILNLDTVLLYQSIFPNQYFVVRRIEDFGDFNEIPDFNRSRPLEVEPRYEKDLYYMKSVQTCSYPSRKLHRKMKLGLKAFYGLLFRKFTSSIFTPELGSSILKFHHTQSYLRACSSIAVDHVDFTKKFVYFPLHLQPELTTSCLGGVYCDQLLALERFVQKLPSDWLIYVKENPKQTEYMRGPWFFERLKSIPSVRFLAISVNTYELIKNCQFVATITGTAGWEAVTGGKNVLVFGRAWYRNMPGVFEFSDDLNINEVVEANICHQDVEAELGRLSAKMPFGVVNPFYVKSVENFDEDENSKNVSDVIEQLMFN